MGNLWDKEDLLTIGYLNMMRYSPIVDVRVRMAHKGGILFNGVVKTPDHFDRGIILGENVFSVEEEE